MQLKLEITGKLKNNVLVSAYSPQNVGEIPPFNELRDLMSHCKVNEIHLIISSDTNANHILRETTVTTEVIHCSSFYAVPI